MSIDNRIKVNLQCFPVKQIYQLKWLIYRNVSNASTTIVWWMSAFDECGLPFQIKWDEKQKTNIRTHTLTIDYIGAILKIDSLHLWHIANYRWRRRRRKIEKNLTLSLNCVRVRARARCEQDFQSFSALHHQQQQHFSVSFSTSALLLLLLPF